MGRRSRPIFGGQPYVSSLTWRGNLAHFTVVSDGCINCLCHDYYKVFKMIRKFINHCTLHVHNNVEFEKDGTLSLFSLSRELIEFPIFVRQGAFRFNINAILVIRSQARMKT
jgi:hypothetical protein